MTTQQIADIAARYDTPMADEMLRACATWSYESGMPVSVPRDRMLRASLNHISAYVIGGEDAYIKGR